MIYARIHRVLKRWQRSGRVPPQSALGKAISHALGQGDSLEVYLKNGTIEIDNNLVENAIRPAALGRTGCFSAMLKPKTAAPYSTPSSNAVAGVGWNLSPTCAIC
jgi:hypothetical protein